jgi:hypothetical protein
MRATGTSHASSRVQATRRGIAALPGVLECIGEPCRAVLSAVQHAKQPKQSNRTNEQTNKQTSEPTKTQTVEQTSQRTNGQAAACDGASVRIRVGNVVVRLAGERARGHGRPGGVPPSPLRRFLSCTCDPAVPEDPFGSSRPQRSCRRSGLGSLSARVNFGATVRIKPSRRLLGRAPAAQAPAAE